MAEFAKAAGVGVGTLYRHFASREDLVAALQVRAFDLLCGLARDAAAHDGTAAEALGVFFNAVIARRDELVLPLRGVPAPVGAGLVGHQREVRATLQTVIDRGHEDGTVQAEVSPFDLIVMGAMLSQPLPHVPDWDGVGARLAGVFVRGLAHPPAGDSA